jgi:hypothetical protein
VTTQICSFSRFSSAYSPTSRCDGNGRAFRPMASHRLCSPVRPLPTYAFLYHNVGAMPRLPLPEPRVLNFEETFGLIYHFSGQQRAKNRIIAGSSTRTKLLCCKLQQFCNNFRSFLNGRLPGLNVERHLHVDSSCVAATLLLSTAQHAIWTPPPYSSDLYSMLCSLMRFSLSIGTDSARQYKFMVCYLTYNCRNC